jgi:hypothetical protein
MAGVRHAWQDRQTAEAKLSRLVTGCDAHAAWLVRQANLCANDNCSTFISYFPTQFNRTGLTLPGRPHWNTSQQNHNEGDAGKMSKHGHCLSTPTTSVKYSGSSISR